MDQMSWPRRCAIAGLAVIGAGFVLASGLLGAFAMQCALTADRLTPARPREEPPATPPTMPPAERTQPAGLRNVAYIFCTWCLRDTVHLRCGSGFVCVNEKEHADTFAYRTLAASYSNADLFPGCICAPGELSTFGQSDPLCKGLEHRP